MAQSVSRPICGRASQETLCSASFPNSKVFACVGAGGFGGVLQEERVEDNVHSSQAKIKVVGLNG